MRVMGSCKQNRLANSKFMTYNFKRLRGISSYNVKLIKVPCVKRSFRLGLIAFLHNQPSFK